MQSNGSHRLHMRRDHCPRPPMRASRTSTPPSDDVGEYPRGWGRRSGNPRRESLRSNAMAEAEDRGWVRAIGRKLRDDLGDVPTLPKEMLDLLEQMKRTTNSAW
jgi:hypothetical protein